MSMIFRQSVALVIGNEGKGLRRLVKENCDELVKIPMAGKMSSLNASVASALLLFEVTRQRRWGLSYSASASSGGVAYSPPAKDFFRSGPDPGLETPDEGFTQAINFSPSERQREDPQDPPGNNRGGGFKW